MTKNNLFLREPQCSFYLRESWKNLQNSPTLIATKTNPLKMCRNRNGNTGGLIKCPMLKPIPHWFVILPIYKFNLAFTMKWNRITSILNSELLFVNSEKTSLLTSRTWSSFYSCRSYMFFYKKSFFCLSLNFINIMLEIRLRLS